MCCENVKCENLRTVHVIIHDMHRGLIWLESTLLQRGFLVLKLAP